MKFEEFVKVPLNAKFKNSETAEKVFLLINNEKMKVKIAEYSREEKPALLACVSEIEFICKDSIDFDLNDNQVRQTIGRMFVRPLKEMGFVQYKRVRMPEGENNFFKNATLFKEKSIYSYSCLWSFTGNRNVRIIFPDLSIDKQCKIDTSVTEKAREVLGEELYRLYEEDLNFPLPSSKKEIEEICESGLYRRTYLTMQVFCDLNYFRYLKSVEGKKIKDHILKSLIIKPNSCEMSKERIEHSADRLAFEVWKCEDQTASLPEEKE